MKLKAILMMMTLSIIGCSDHKKVDDNHLSTAKISTKIIARIDDHEITDKQFHAYLKFKRLLLKNDDRRLKVIEKYVQREALADAIEKENYLDHDLIAVELNEFRKEMLISRYFEKFLKQAVTDQAVQNYYHTHISAYEAQKAHAAHILIRTHKTMSEPERLAKLTTAQEAYSKIRTGISFSTIANDYSEDKNSTKKGGDLGWIKKGSIDPQFSKTLFALKPEEVSLPVETAFGFHIVKLVEAPKTIRRPFEAVASEIRYQLRNEAKQAELNRLKKKLIITINKERGKK